MFLTSNALLKQFTLLIINFFVYLTKFLRYKIDTQTILDQRKAKLLNGLKVLNSKNLFKIFITCNKVQIFNLADLLKRSFYNKIHSIIIL